jgi:DNA mismatch repair ATPase MutS
MASVLTRTPFLAALLITLGYGFFLGSRTLQVAGAVNSPARDLSVLAKLLHRLENDHFEAALLQRLREDLGAGGLVASFQLGRLRRLVARLDWQRNLFFTPIAMAILWSAQIAMAIERWRRLSGRHISEWISAVGEFEALVALAGYSYEHPHDSFPELLDAAGGKLEAHGLGHPLMREGQCVPNDVRMGGDLRLLIVSGSNMSGKSTLLRAVGLNVVLAWAGAPVRAQSFAVSPLTVGASIRVMDSLQDGKSRFYAEITRLREIVNLTGGDRTVLFLLDELLSGTNSHDRKIGAEAIVRSLIDRGAIGMITTHDLALAHIADDLPGRALNVHFADTLEDGRLHFDYQLQPGIVERSNALDLMRSVGLEV